MTHRPEQSGYTPIHAAAWNGRTSAVEALHRLGARVALANKVRLSQARGARTLCVQDGYTPIHCASKSGHTDTVALLVRLGADANQPRWVR